MTQSISPSALENLRQRANNLDLIDVRSPAEFEEVHLEFARNVPLDQLDPEDIRRTRATSSDEPLYVICQKGGRGKQACEKLAAAGLANVVNVDGGTVACEAAGLPVVRGRKTISLERQVQIAAGSLVLIGSLLGFFVHFYLMALPAFVGAGLVFAGVTNTCGMALLLARMPWNRTGGSSASSSCSIDASLGGDRDVEGADSLS